MTARDGAENECTNRKAEILQQTILVHIDTSKIEFHLKTLIPVRMSGQQKAEILQQTINVHIDIIIKDKISPKERNISEIRQ